MANLRLKKLILEVVENQLRDNDPPAAKQAYRKLIDGGYTAKEAKEKIGAVVLTEIYDVMKENQSYDEKRYQLALEEMVQQCLDFEDTHAISTEWDEWDDLVQQGYGVNEVHGAQNSDEVINCWWKAWELFKKIIAQENGKCSISSLMEEQDYRYPIDAWLQDFEMELGNSGEHEKWLEFCRSVLDMFVWTVDDNSNFRSAIGESLYATGKAEEGKAWFENWLKEEPHNENALSVFSWCLEENEGAEAAYRLIRKEVIGASCTMYNSLLFERAKDLAQHLQLTDDLKWIESQLQSFMDSMAEADLYNDLDDDFRMPVQKPIVKEKKIYPNDPCPCGSGKKYKKCCGRK